MGSRLSLDDKLAAIRRLRDEPSSPEQTAELRRYIADRSNLVVAAAAAIAGDKTLVELAGDLEAAFGRFLVNPLKDDKLCRAKIAAIKALEKLEHQEPGAFRRAAVHVQFEPVWGGEVDTAAPLRAAALCALTRVGDAGDLALLADALADPEKDVRCAAAQALAAFGSDGPALLLRFKAKIGDSEPDVLSECLSGLLAVDPRENVPLVCGFLNPDDPARCEAAALALGRSRLPEALDALKSCWQRCASSELRRQVLLAIATMRLPGAIDYLVALVSEGSEQDAIAVLSVLKIHDYDPRLRDRLGEIVKRRKSAAVQKHFEREFPPERAAQGR